ncbi:MAG TPA: hypothetical protein VF546_09075 [Pyrinomonadaceae bacterium]|jgi:hypothetical protein
MKSAKLSLTLALLCWTAACAGGSGDRAAAPACQSEVDTLAGVAPAVGRDYLAPDGAFRVQLPAGWTVESETHDGLTMTWLKGDRDAGMLLVMSSAGPPPTDDAGLQARYLEDGGKPLFGAWIDMMKEVGRVEGTGRVCQTRVKGTAAMRTNVTFYRGDANDPRAGYGLFLFGPSRQFFFGLTGHDAGLRAAEAVLASLELEPGR